MHDKIASIGDVATILYNAYNHEANFEYTTPGKPVIYLYPRKETDVKVEVAFNGEFTFTYPEYNHGWAVTARLDGTLISGATEYAYLFWEGKVRNYSPKVANGTENINEQELEGIERKGFVAVECDGAIEE